MAEYSQPFPYGQLVSACNVLFGKGCVKNIPMLQVDEIKRAYRRVVKEVHPDLIPDRSTSSFRQVTEAYELLLKHAETRRITHQKQRETRARYGRDAGTMAPPRPRAAKSSQGLKAPKLTMYNGPMPTIPLKIGLYLYYSGKISYEMLVQALLWQQAMRPPLGELAIKAKFLTASEVQRIMESKTVFGQFGERAIKLGFLAESQVAQLLRIQRGLQKPLGLYFVQRKLLTTYELTQAARNMEKHNQAIMLERNSRQILIGEISL